MERESEARGCSALLVLFVVGMLVKGMTTLQQGVERLVDGEESDDREFLHVNIQA